ncbi:class I SAM-dependent methyltransferase [Candidatus Pseudothioglobus singularis]|nr:class I SAM-dependent methyltransferase [Candidatus Pseudothioglobus singularis]
MKKNTQGLKLYDSLDLSESENKKKLLDIYQKWAALYDKDNDDELGTVSQPNSVQTFQRYVKDKSKYIIDVGCGTGLVGLQLKKLGYKNFDGVDISQEMIDIAIDRGYASLSLGNLNETLPIKSNQYEAAICVGVFTHGHVGPSRLEELTRIVKPGGILCFTVNEDVYESYGFDEAIKSQELAGVWKVLELSKKDYMMKKNVKGLYCIAEVI